MSCQAYVEFYREALLQRAPLASLAALVALPESALRALSGTAAGADIDHTLSSLRTTKLALFCRPPTQRQLDHCASQQDIGGYDLDDKRGPYFLFWH